MPRSKSKKTSAAAAAVPSEPKGQRISFMKETYTYNSSFSRT
jgi:hypothetical protein